MWIKVQEPRMLVEPRLIEVRKGILKKSKYNIIGKLSHNSQEFEVTLGIYDNEEVAYRIFEEIEQAILSDKKIYVMTESNMIY